MPPDHTPIYPPTDDMLHNFVEDYIERQYPIPRHIPPIQVGNDRFPLYRYINPQAN